MKVGLLVDRSSPSNQACVIPTTHSAKQKTTPAPKVSAGRGTLFGVGSHANIITASLLAVISAANRALGRGLIEAPGAVKATPGAAAAPGVRVSARS